VEGCRPEPFSVAPSEARGPSALACLGMTKREACLGMTSRSAVPNKVRRDAVPSKARGLPGDAVPSEARDASLTLGTTG
jgi:hypothetical protein